MLQLIICYFIFLSLDGFNTGIEAGKSFKFRSSSIIIDTRSCCVCSCLSPVCDRCMSLYTVLCMFLTCCIPSPVCDRCTSLYTVLCMFLTCSIPSPVCDRCTSLYTVLCMFLTCSIPSPVCDRCTSLYTVLCTSHSRWT